MSLEIEKSRKRCAIHFCSTIRIVAFSIQLYCLLFFGVANAQQNPQFTQYFQNPFVVNPAITGVESYLDLTTSFRNQWTSFDGAPSTATFSFNTPLHLLKKKLQRKEGQTHQGIGAFIYSDETGPFKKGGFYGSYAYHLKLSQDWFLSAGTFLGINQFKYDSSEAVLLNNPSDILVQNLSTINFDMSLGLYLYSKYFFAGVAANQIFDNKIPFSVDNGIITTDGRLNRNFNLLVGSRLELSEQWEAVPSALLKTVADAPVQLELGAKMVYDDKLWGGLGYRNQDAVTILAGMRFLKDFLFSYSYDYAISDLNGKQSGTHEFIVGYRFDFGNQKCACPNYSL